MTRVFGAFVALVVIFGTTFSAIKIGIVDGWPPLLAAGLRFTIAGLLVLAVAYTTGSTKRLTTREVGRVASVGLCCTAITFGALYSAERVLPSGIAAVLSATGPLFAVALALIAGSRRFDPSIAIGVVTATVGVMLVAGPGAIRGPAALLASLAIVASEAAYSWGLSQAKPLRATLPALQLAGLQQLIGGTILLLLSLVFEHHGPERIDGSGVLALAYLIVAGSAIAHTLAIWLSGVASATFASSWSYLSPFIALLAGAAYLHELPGPAAFLGGLFVVVGAALLNRDLRSTLAHQPVDAAV